MRAVLVSALLLAAACDRGTVVDIDTSALDHADAVELYVATAKCETADPACAGVQGPGMTSASPRGAVYYRSRAAAYTTAVESDGHARFHLESPSGTTDVPELVAVVRDAGGDVVGYARLEPLSVGQKAKSVQLAAAPTAAASSTTGQRIVTWSAPGDDAVRCLAFQDLAKADKSFAMVLHDDPDCDGITAADECLGQANVAQLQTPADTLCLTADTSMPNTPVCYLGVDCSGDSGTCGASNMCISDQACQCGTNVPCIEHTDALLECQAALSVGMDCHDAEVAFDLTDKYAGCEDSPPTVLVVGDTIGVAFSDFGPTATFQSGASVSKIEVDGCSGKLTISGHDDASVTPNPDTGLIAFGDPQSGHWAVVPFVIHYAPDGVCSSAGDPTTAICDPLVGTGGEGQDNGVWSCVN